jgi:hypothetical protein
VARRIVALVFLLSVFVFAAVGIVRAAAPLLSLTSGPQDLGPKGKQVNLSSGGVVTLPDGQIIPLTTVGGGLRRKRVVVFQIPVYFGQLLVDPAAAVTFPRDPDRALDALEPIRTVAMHLLFLWDVTGDQISAAFKEAFATNGYNFAERPDLQELQKIIAMTGSIRRGMTAVLIARAGDNQRDIVVYEAPDGRISQIDGRAGFKRAVLSAWFGKASDAGLRSLKAQIVGAESHP